MLKKNTDEIKNPAKNMKVDVINGETITANWRDGLATAINNAKLNEHEYKIWLTTINKINLTKEGWRPDIQ